MAAGAPCGLSLDGRLGLVGGGAQDRLPNRLGLEEIPQVGRFGMTEQRVGLRALAAHFRDRQRRGQDGDQ
jgi:hypothetical protein